MLLTYAFPAASQLHLAACSKLLYTRQPSPSQAHRLLMHFRHSKISASILCLMVDLSFPSILGVAAPSPFYFPTGSGRVARDGCTNPKHSVGHTCIHTSMNNDASHAESTTQLNAIYRLNTLNAFYAYIQLLNTLYIHRFRVTPIIQDLFLSVHTTPVTRHSLIRIRFAIAWADPFLRGS